MELLNKTGIIYGLFGVAFLFWICTYELITKSVSFEENEKSLKLSETWEKLNSSKKELDEQRVFNRKLRKLLKKHLKNTALNLKEKLPRLDLKKPGSIKKEPTFKYEQLRRRIKTNINEFFNFLKYESNKLDQESEMKLTHMLPLANEMKL